MNEIGDERALSPFRTEGDLDGVGRRAGKWRAIDDEGRVRLEVDFVEGRAHGRLLRRHPSGEVLERGAYHGGRRVGTFEAFYADGSRWYRYELDNDSPVGIWELWHPGGVLSRRIDWSVVERKDDGGIIDDEDDVEEPPQRMQAFDFEGKPGIVLLGLPAHVDLHRGRRGVVVYEREPGGFFFLAPDEAPLLLAEAKLPPLRPLMALNTTSRVVDFDRTSPDGFCTRHHATFKPVEELLAMDDEVLVAWVGTLRMRVAELAEAAGEPVRLPPLLWAISDVTTFEAEVPRNGLECTAENWGPRRLRHLADGYAHLGDDARAVAVLSLLQPGLAKRVGRRLRRALGGAALLETSSELSWFDRDAVLQAIPLA